MDATDSHENKTSVAEILAGEFPWSALLGMVNASVLIGMV